MPGVQPDVGTGRPARTKATTLRADSKGSKILELIGRPKGATLAEIRRATDLADSQCPPAFSPHRQEARSAFSSAAGWRGWTWAESAALTTNIGSYSDGKPAHRAVSE